MQYIKNDWDPQNLFNHAQSIVGTPRPLLLLHFHT
ncbi:BBE domain-containing protein [Vibrio campbellii]|uniref:BBE domain-containing protein n=1 Tax=Vibrio campbellii TaxID=680 RepID=A0ACC7R2A2_9VIBR